MALLVKELLRTAREGDRELRGKSDIEVLYRRLAGVRHLALAGDTIKISERLRELGGRVDGMTRAWVFENPDAATLRTLCELIHARLITVSW